MDDSTDSIFAREILTSQTGIDRDCQNWMLQVAFSEIKLLISDFSIVDFRFSGIAICDS